MSESPWSLDTAATCLRKYQNLVKLRLPSPSNPAAQSGITWHKMMEAYHPGANLAAALELAGEDFTLRAMITKYAETYPNPVTQISQESRFDLDGFKGRIDAVWDVPEGRVVVEHKTTALNIDDFITLRTFDRQTMVYFLVEECDAVLLDIVSRPKHKTYEGAYNAVQCRRALIYKTESDVVHFLRDDAALRATIQSCEDAGYYPRNPSACISYGQICSFFASCSNG